MPYACALFDETIDTCMRETVNRIAANSAFVPQEQPFHVPLFGSLHAYTDDDVTSALATVPELHGRFIKWELDRSSLVRAVVELNETDMLMAHLGKALPNGKRWRSLYVTLGSAAGIEAAQREAFLAAISEAFPIDPSSHFKVGTLVFRNDPLPSDKTSGMQPPKNETTSNTTATTGASLTPHAPPFEPKPAAPKHKAIRKKRAKHKSPHRTWERTVTIEDGASRRAPVASSAIDQLIMKGGANPKAAKAAQAARKKNAAARAAAVQEARMMA